MKISIEVDGKNHLVQAQKIAGKLWIHLFGKTMAVDEDSRKSARKKGSSAAQSVHLLAPMPGKVTKLFKKSGELVKKGDAVLVMEAMKMEYTLKAQAEAHIAQIHCQIGDQVVLGKMLVEFKLEEKSK
jgi:acetyl/propionyl-CoA carboxylase alpha subunit